MLSKTWHVVTVQANTEYTGINHAIYRYNTIIGANKIIRLNERLSEEEDIEGVQTCSAFLSTNASAWHRNMPTFSAFKFVSSRSKMKFTELNLGLNVMCDMTSVLLGPTVIIPYYVQLLRTTLEVYKLWYMSKLANWGENVLLPVIYM